MDKQNLIDNILVEVFKRFYENVLKDQHLAVFFSSEEQISELITKQYEAFRGTLFQSSEQTKPSMKSWVKCTTGSVYHFLT